MPQVLSAATINARRRVVSELKDEGVTSPEVAIQFEPRKSSEAAYFHSLRQAGALRSTRQGLTYLDVQNFEAYTSDRNRRIVGYLGGAITVFAGLMLASRK